MPNFGAVLPNIAAPLAQTVASHNFADIAERDKQRQMALQEIALSRQAQQDANLKALQDSTINRNNATATKALMPPVRNIDPYSQQGVDAAVDRATRLQAIAPPKLNPHPFMLNGKATLGFADERGGLYGSDAKPLPPGSKVAPFTPPPQSSYTPVTLGGSNGQPPQVVPFNTKTGGTLTPIGDKPPGAGGSGTGAQTSIADLLRTHRAMSQIENDPTFGISGADESQESLNYAKKRGMAQPTSGTPIVTALSAGINAVHPANDRAFTYLQNARSFGEDAAQSFKGRTNEERVLRDVANSRLDQTTSKLGGDRKAIQDRRANIIGMAAQANPDQLNALSPQDRAEVQSYMAGTGGAPMPQPGGHGKALSPEDAAHAQRDPAFAKWLRGKGYDVP